MFGNSRKIKELESDLEDLKILCTQLTNNAITMLKDQALLTQAVKNLLERQKVIEKFINTKYAIATANDDDDIIH